MFENINEKIFGEVIIIIEVLELGIGILLLYIWVLSWVEYVNNENFCEKCIDDIGFIIYWCLFVGCNCLLIVFFEFVFGKN